MANDISIQIIAEVKKALTDFKKFQDEATDSFKKVGDAADKLVGSTDGLASNFKKVAAGFLAFKTIESVTGFFSEATKKAIEFEESLQGVKLTASNFGISTKAVEEAVKDLSDDGFIPLRSAANALRDLLQSGLNLDQATKLLNGFKEAAVANRSSIGDLGSALEQAAEGFAKNRDQAIKNISVAFDSKKAVDDYARSIGKTTEQLSQGQIQQARYNAFLKQSEQFTGASKNALNTLSGSLNNLANAYEDIQVSIGKFATGNYFAIDAINLLADVLKSISEAIDSARERFNGLYVTLLELNLPFLKLTKNIEDFLDKITGTNFFSKLSKAGEDYAKSLKIIEEAQKKLGEETAKTTAEQQKQAEEASKYVDQIAKDFDELNKALIKSTNTTLKNLEIERDERLKLVNEAVKIGAKTEEEAASIRLLIEKDFTQKYQEELDRRNDKTNKSLQDQNQIYQRARDITNKFIEQSRTAISNIASNPAQAFLEIGIIQDDYIRQTQELQKLLEKNPKLTKELNNELSRLGVELERVKGQLRVAITGAILSSIAQGEQGAKNLVTGLAEVGLTKVFGPAAEAFRPLLQAFAQGPEAVKKLVTEFTKAFPIVIQGFIEAIPAFIDALISNIPMLLDSFVGIIDSLVLKAPEIITSLIDKLPLLISSIISRIPEIATKLAIAFAFEVPAAFIREVPKIIEAIVRGVRDGIAQAVSSGYEGVENIVQNATNFATNLIKNPVQTIVNVAKDPLSIFRGAEGGQAYNVRGGIEGKDSVPAMLMPGELVVDRSTAFALKDFLANQGTNDYDVVVASKLASIEELLKNPQIVNGEIKIGYSVLQEAIISLNRTKARLA